MSVGAVIGALRANLSLNSAQFEKGLKNARRSLGKARADMQRIATGAGIAGAALGAMGAQAVSAARDVDRLSKVANTTPKQLQRWSAATRTVGLDQEKLSDILRDVNDRVGDFMATGGGPMADFFENIAPKVGVTAAQFEKLSGPEALQLYVSSLEKAGVSQQQFTFYMEAMASDATLLLPLLRNNGKEMARLGDAAEEAGAVMSNTAIANLVKMGETSDRIRDSFVAMRGEVAGALAPSFERLAGTLQRAMGEGGALRRVMVGLAENADRITAYVTAAAGAFGAYATAVTLASLTTKKFKAALVRTGIGAIVVGLGEAVYQFMQLKQATGDTGNTLTLFGDLAKGVVNYAFESFFWLGNRIIGVFRGAFNAVKETWDKLPAVMGALMVGGANATIGAVEGLINGINSRVNSMISGVNAAISALPDWAGGGGKLSIGMIGTSDFGRIANPWAEQAKQAGREAGAAFMKGVMTDTRAAPKIFDVPDLKRQWARIQNIIKKSNGTAKASTALEDLRTKLEDVATMPKPETGGGSAQTPAAAIDRMSDSARRAKSAMGTLRDGLAGVFSSVLRGADSARNAVSGLLDRLSDMAAQSAFKALFNGAMGGSFGSGLGSIMGSIFGGVPAFANGGMAPGGLSMVGERGPELVNLPGGSRVFSAAESAQMANNDPIRLEVALSGDLEARVLDAAQAEAVRITRAGLEEYDRSGAPRRMAAYQQDPRRRG